MDMIHKSLLESLINSDCFENKFFFMLSKLMSECYAMEDILKAKARINMI